MISSRPRLGFALLYALLASGTAVAGGSGENVLLIVDPTSAKSRYVANHYKSERGIPDANVLYMAPGASDYQEFVDVNLEGFLGTLAGRNIADHIDYVVISASDDFFISAVELVPDTCVRPIERFTLPGAYILAHQANDILTGGFVASTPNEYAMFTWDGEVFSNATSWLNGAPSAAAGAERYYIGALLGYTGPTGNQLQEILDLIDRSVAADGTHPVGTVYYMETSDFERSSPRHDFYPTAVTEMASRGGAGQHLFGDLPLGQQDCMGIMTGLGSPDIDGADLTLLPGSFADHLTSFGGSFDWTGPPSQTRMSRWISKGASGTAGTIEEPCAFAGKFPHARFHTVYRDGFTLGESWFRSVGFAPFQNLLYGDPLTQPYAYFPSVDVPDVPVAPVSGMVTLTPAATTPAPGAQIVQTELFLDGVHLADANPGEAFTLDTTLLADGWHELRVLARDDAANENVGRWIGSIEVANSARAVTLSATPTIGDLDEPFGFSFSATGGTISEVLLYSNGRVIASSSSATETLTVYGQNLGAGSVTVRAEAVFDGGERAMSAPVALDVTFEGGLSTDIAPVAYGYTRNASGTEAFVLELPATFVDDPVSATYTIVQPPTMTTILSGGTGAFRVVEPLPGASGIDSLTFRVENHWGSSEATIQIQYPPSTCGDTESYCSTSPNSVGPGALMNPTGSVSITAADFALEAQGCPLFQFGHFYYGPDQVEIPFGDGFRCVGGQTFRLPIVIVSISGIATLALDYSDPPELAGQITAGSTWNFQFWYRDPLGGVTGYNLSDGLSVTFCP